MKSCIFSWCCIAVLVAGCSHPKDRFASVAVTVAVSEPAAVAAPETAHAGQAAPAPTPAAARADDWDGSIDTLVFDREGEEPKEGPVTADAPAEAAKGGEPALLAPALPQPVTDAKAMIDKMAGKMEKMVAEVEDAGSNEAQVKAIGEKFKADAESMKAEGEALNRRLSGSEKKEVEAYGKEKMGPIMGKLMGAMMKSQMGKLGQ